MTLLIKITTKQKYKKIQQKLINTIQHKYKKKKHEYIINT